MRGRLIVFVGKPMAGKSTRMIRMANAFPFRSSCIITPASGASATNISRDIDYKYPNRLYHYTILPTYQEFVKDHQPIKYLFIDEFQMFKSIKNIRTFLAAGIKVYAFGLVTRGSQYILSMADKIVKLKDPELIKNSHKGLSIYTSSDSFYKDILESMNCRPYTSIFVTSEINTFDSYIYESVDTKEIDVVDFYDQINVLQKKNKPASRDEIEKLVKESRYRIMAIWVDCSRYDSEDVIDALAKYYSLGLDVMAYVPNGYNKIFTDLKNEGCDAYMVN